MRTVMCAAQQIIETGVEAPKDGDILDWVRAEIRAEVERQLRAEVPQGIASSATNHPVISQTTAANKAAESPPAATANKATDRALTGTDHKVTDSAPTVKASKVSGREHVNIDDSSINVNNTTNIGPADAERNQAILPITSAMRSSSINVDNITNVDPTTGGSHGQAVNVSNVTNISPTINIIIHSRDA